MKHSEETHGHVHSHEIPKLDATSLTKAFYIGIGLNIAYILVELGFGFKHDSTALLSDAVHNLGDVSSLVLALIAFKLTFVRATQTFSYGLKKGTVLASFFNSMFLAVSVGIIAWESIDKMMNPVNMQGLIISIVAGVGVIINGFSAYLFHDKQKSDLNSKAAFWHLVADALVSLGVVVSGIIIHYTHFFIMDGIIGLVISVVILFSSWDLFKDSIVSILDGKPDSVDLDELITHIKHIPDVLDVHHIHCWNISTQEIGLTAHIVINEMSVVPFIKSKIKDELEEHGIVHATLEFETLSEQCSDLTLVSS